MENKQIISVTIDTGFSGAKCIVNKKHYFVEADCVNITANNKEAVNKGFNRNGEQTIMVTVNDETYLIGSAARNLKLVDSNERKAFAARQSAYESEKRFTDDYYKKQLYAYIAYALTEYMTEVGKVSDLQDPEVMKSRYAVIISVVLPQSSYKNSNILTEIQRFLIGPHSADVNINGTMTKVNYEIGENSILVYSQALCVLMQDVLNDIGECRTEMEKYVTQDNILIIDGGYVTVGLVGLFKNLAAPDETSQSNKDFAMKNINVLAMKNIEKEVTENGGNIEKLGINDFNLEASNGTKVYKTFKSSEAGEDDSPLKTVDLDKHKLNATKEVTEALVNYLYKEDAYDVINCKGVFVAGGTGKAYMQQGDLENLISKKWGLKKEDIHLVSGTLGGKTVDPVFAVAAGAHKMAAGEIRKIEGYEKFGE